MMRRNVLLLSAVALAALQIGFLAWIIAGRAAVLRDGREAVFRIEPIDPRDLMRGDYVWLRYEISALPYGMIENAPQGELTEAGPIYVRTRPGADGYWHPVSASMGAPSANAGTADSVEVRGLVDAGQSFGPGTTIRIDYGIERFYVPEGEGRAIEKDMNVRPFGVKLAVADDGTSQIKALMDGQTTLFEEPLY